MTREEIHKLPWEAQEYINSLERKMKHNIMKGKYIPFNDGFGIVGYAYECPECNYHSLFTDCEEGCKKCGFNEPYKDPDDWYDEEMSKPKDERAWNVL